MLSTAIALTALTGLSVVYLASFRDNAPLLSTGETGTKRRVSRRRRMRRRMDRI